MEEDFNEVESEEVIEQSVSGGDLPIVVQPSLDALIPHLDVLSDKLDSLSVAVEESSETIVLIQEDTAQSVECLDSIQTDIHLILTLVCSMVIFWTFRCLCKLFSFFFSF